MAVRVRRCRFGWDKMRLGGYPDDWDDRRKRVLERDGYECQRCGATDTTLQAHHRKPISKGGSHDLSNLETLCRACHAAEHPTKVIISQALAENRRLRMKYRSASGTRVRELDPYGMAMHEGIQYLVGHDYYRDEIRIFRPKRIESVELQSESFDPPTEWNTEAYLADEMGYRRTAKGGGNGCFIATAAYETPAASEIDVLRAFRDDVLAESRLTRWTIPTYYRLSPLVARWISQSEGRRRVVRQYLVGPAVRWIPRLWNVRDD